MRKRRAVKRDVLPDPVYKSKVVTKLVNQIMIDGKRGKAETIVYDAFDIIKEKTNSDPNEVFTKALENVKIIPIINYITLDLSFSYNVIDKINKLLP